MESARDTRTPVKRSREDGMSRMTRSLTVAVLLAAGAALAQQPCGSALLAERSLPPAFEGIALGEGAVARMWAAGAASLAFSGTPCQAGCVSLTASPLCAGGGDCLAVGGVTWLNAPSGCATAGYRPPRTVLVVEGKTAADGGRWAALDLATNSGDANTDLDAAAAAWCGGSCSSVASPCVGGSQQSVTVMAALPLAGDQLLLELAWAEPRAEAQALNSRGASLVTGWGVHVARSVGGVPPDRSGAIGAAWQRLPDTDATATGNGFSTDRHALVTVGTGGTAEDVFVALMPVFDGGGDPLVAGSNSRAASYVSRGWPAYRPGQSLPTVTRVAPAVGGTGGGTPVRITGTGFASGMAVTFDGQNATTVTFENPNVLTATTPAHAAGPVDVAVINPGALAVALPASFTYQDLASSSLALDTHAASGTTGNLNGVLEPGEQVLLEPAWSNLGTTALDLAGEASGFTGPAGATYSLVDQDAAYGAVDAGQTRSCWETGDCYQIDVSVPPTRPAAHWDASLAETLSNGSKRTWTVHLGNSFADVPVGYWAYRFVETMVHSGITGGCGGGNYCPTTIVTRWQMAVFLSLALAGPNVPMAGSVAGLGSYRCGIGGWSLFADVPATDGGCRFVHFLAAKGITSGCGGGNYCPSSSITRWQMAVFLAVALAGAGSSVQASGTVPQLGDYNCVAGGQSVFLDVPPTDPGCKHIHYIAARGITSGCGGGNYCPTNPLGRDQMAVFLTKAFELTLW